MDLDLNDDQLALRDGIRALLDGRFGSDRVRGGYDAAMHDELVDAGVFSLLADGFSYADAVVVFEQLGEYAVPGPLVATFLAAGLDGAGDRPLATSHIEPGDQTGPLLVEHPDAIAHVLVVDHDGMRRVERADLDGAAVTWPLDPLTPMLRVDAIPAGTPCGDAAAAGAARVRGATLTAAYALGMASRLADMAVAYAKEREQFDRPIGSFQAIKHLLADMAVRTEVARAAVYAAGAALVERDSTPARRDSRPEGHGVDVERTVSVAKVIAGEAAVVNGKSATQVHGGMGFTWEVDVHLYLKRAWLLETHFGSVEHHARLLAG